jgi:hypothetical protein
MSFSMRVTRAPLVDAVVAAWVPAGPPPMIRMCVVSPAILKKS